MTFSLLHPLANGWLEEIMNVLEKCEKQIVDLVSCVSYKGIGKRLSVLLVACTAIL